MLPRPHPRHCFVVHLLFILTFFNFLSSSLSLPRRLFLQRHPPRPGMFGALMFQHQRFLAPVWSGPLSFESGA
ncbi:hypothetical protein HDK64DRAFT_280702 [Phyllosticta capitalensis]